MRLSNAKADLFVPDGVPLPDALQRITHLGVGGHQDDLEFMAFHGVVTCFHDPRQWFGGVTCTNGGGSPRAGAYASTTDDQMQEVRRQEQRQAAMIGRYGVMAQLGHASQTIKDPADRSLQEDLQELLGAMRPAVIYTHNLADKHDTHIAVAVSLLRAVRALPAERRPRQVLGCEVWRGLDWMPDKEKMVLDVTGYDNLAAAINGVFDSQIAGGKRYDLATVGRRRANATFFESHGVDDSDQVWLAMDLTPLVEDPGLDPVAYVDACIGRFAGEVRQRLAKQLGPG
ncbi:PIG-L family deacetylase [bacterium]|nr:PIG-L family deacetylase [bacterium]